MVVVNIIKYNMDREVQQQIVGEAKVFPVDFRASLERTLAHEVSDHDPEVEDDDDTDDDYDPDEEEDDEEEDDEDDDTEEDTEEDELGQSICN